MRFGDLTDLIPLWSQLRHPGQYLKSRRAGVRAPIYDIELRDSTIVRLRGPSRDFHVFHRIMLNDEYAVRDLDLAGKKVLDIGAHAGFFALCCARLGASVVCAEPAPDNLVLLSHNVRRNEFQEKIAIQETAISSSADPKTLCRKGDPYGYYLGKPESPLDVSVPTMTLQTLLERHNVEEAALLKLDCEGSEYEIISSTPAELLRRCERIRMEYHALAGRTDLCSLLRERLTASGFDIETDIAKKNGKQGYLFCRRT